MTTHAAGDGAGPAAGGPQPGGRRVREDGYLFAVDEWRGPQDGFPARWWTVAAGLRRVDADLLCIGPRLAALAAALTEALVPLAILVLDERSNGPIREICPELREAIRKGHDAARAALAGGGAGEGGT